MRWYLSTINLCGLTYECGLRHIASITFAHHHIKIAKTGALCCVAAGPHGAKSNTGSRDCSLDSSEPHWRVNSSFSPPLSRRWDCRFQSDGLPHGARGAPTYDSSLSSHSKGSRSGGSSDQYLNHHHSVSDGALPYFESPSEILQAPRWTPPVQRFDLGEFSTPVGGARPDIPLFPRCTERRFTAGASSMSNSLGSASPLSESGQWASTSKQPIFFPPRNFSGKRSFMSKPVYPLVFRNPVSDSEACGLVGTSNGSRMTPSDNHRSSPTWPESTLSPDLKFHKTLTELQNMEASPEPGTSSRREGFRWSNASSYEFGFDGDAVDISEHIGLENLRSPYNPAAYQKCGLCERSLWQKSPWSSSRIVRSNDMPVAGVLPCSHVFHAECLEETTPKSQIHEPPCPLCHKSVTVEGSTSFSVPLQMALRSVRRSQGVNLAYNDARAGSNLTSVQNEGDLRRNQSLPVSQRGGGSLMKGHFKKRFSFKGKMGKDLFGAKLFRRTGSSSSTGHQVTKTKLGI